MASRSSRRSVKTIQVHLGSCEQRQAGASWCSARLVVGWGGTADGVAAGRHWRISWAMDSILHDSPSSKGLVAISALEWPIVLV